jgi:hypothetical protein
MFEKNMNTRVTRVQNDHKPEWNMLNITIHRVYHFPGPEMSWRGAEKSRSHWWANLRPGTQTQKLHLPIHLSTYLSTYLAMCVYLYIDIDIYIWVPQLVLIITNFGWFWGPILANPHILDTYRVLGHLIWTPTIVIEAAEPLMGGYLSFRYEVCDMFDDFVGVCLKRVSPKIQGYPMVNHNVPISMTILIREYN